MSTVHHIQALVRGRRQELGLSQEFLAVRAGTSRKWLSQFELGTTTAVELPLVLRVLAALDLVVDIAPSRPVALEHQAENQHDEELDLDDVLRAYADRNRR